MLSQKRDTVYRYFKELMDKWLIEKIPKEDYYRLTEAGLEYKYHDDGKKSESNRKKIQSEKNPTYDNTEFYNIDDNTEWEFSDREDDLNIPLTGEQDSPQPVSETTIPWKSITLEQFIERRNAIDTLKQNNITVRGFKKCRSPNDDIRAEWNKIRKKYLDVDIITACDNYITDIETRKPKADSDYHEHRFSLYAFLTQKNWFIKFANL